MLYYRILTVSIPGFWRALFSDSASSTHKTSSYTSSYNGGEGLQELKSGGDGTAAVIAVSVSRHGFKESIWPGNCIRCQRASSTNSSHPPMKDSIHPMYHTIKTQFPIRSTSGIAAILVLSRLVSLCTPTGSFPYRRGKLLARCDNFGRVSRVGWAGTELVGTVHICSVQWVGEGNNIAGRWILDSIIGTNNTAIPT